MSTIIHDKLDHIRELSKDIRSIQDNINEAAKELSFATTNLRANFFRVVDNTNLIHLRIQSEDRITYSDAVEFAKWILSFEKEKSE
jgi:hypothetical protein